jgi:hypothetical protein
VKRTLLVLAPLALLACSGGGGGGVPPAPPPPPIVAGLLLAPAEWAALPRKGDADCPSGSPCALAWDNVVVWAERWDDPGLFPDLTEWIDDNSDHDVIALACALAWRGSDDDVWRARARLLISQAVGRPYPIAGVSALRPGRNLLSYVLAASTIELGALDPQLDAAFRAWIEKVAERDLWVGEGVTQPGTFRAYHEHRPNNVGLVVGAARIAVDLYLGGDEHEEHLEEAQRVFRGFVGDDTAYEFPDASFGGTRDDNSWQPDERPGHKEGIAPPGAMIRSAGLDLDVDGCLPEEMRRLGDASCAPCGLVPSILCYNRSDALDGGVPPGIGATGYPWEALQGLVMQAWLLQRAGYDSFAWGDAAVERALRFLYLTYGLRPEDTWSDRSQPDDPACCSGTGDRTRVDDTWVPHVARAGHGAAFLDDVVLVYGGRPGKNCGFADWWTLGRVRPQRSATSGPR